MSSPWSATCLARAATVLLNPSPLATKSVSQVSSTRAPTPPSQDTSTAPCWAARPARRGRLGGGPPGRRPALPPGGPGRRRLGPGPGRPAGPVAPRPRVGRGRRGDLLRLGQHPALAGGHVPALLDGVGDDAAHEGA